MPIRSRENLLGAWAFLIGIILAIVGGLIATLIAGTRVNVNQGLLGFLAFLGIVVGYFVAEKDVKTFLLASVAVVIVSFAGLQGGVLSAAILGIVNVNKLMTNILGALMFLFIPATIVVASKTVFAIARS